MPYVQVTFADADFTNEIQDLVAAVRILKPNFDLSGCTEAEQNAHGKINSEKSGSFYKSMALLPCGMAVMAEVGSMFETIEMDKAQQEALALLLQKVEGFKPFIASNFQFEDLVFMFTCFRCRVIECN